MPKARWGFLVFTGLLAAGGCSTHHQHGLTPDDSTTPTSTPDDPIDPNVAVDDDDWPGPGECASPLVDPPKLDDDAHLVTADSPPPPISGGTLLVTRDGATAVAADPDRDLVYGVDLATSTVRFTATLNAGDEPGRLVEDGAGRVHVALRGGGALADVDLATGLVIARRPVCPAPRGTAWDATTDTIWVACATGELVGLPAAGGAATTSRTIERDLRDVVVQESGLAISTFRSAQLLKLDASGNLTGGTDLPSGEGSDFVSHVAWRTIAGTSGQILSVHQVESLEPLSTETPGGYGANCDRPPPVMGVLTTVARDGTAASKPIAGEMPVDVALSADGADIAIVFPGDAFAGLPTLQVIHAGSDVGGVDIPIEGQPTAVAFDAQGRVLVQSREPAMLRVVALVDGGTTIASATTLSTISRKDTGSDIFHTQAGLGIACASCHPEGGDDGHVWDLDGQKRRTPSLRGTIAGTAPYHWPGDMKDFSDLVHDVYVNRMKGQPLTTGQLAALESWVEAIPAPPAPSWVDGLAALRGKAIFESKGAACSTCHSGAKLTDNLTVDIGTGGAFQVPPLVGVGWRTPFLHDGCAATFADRFGKCATPQHGSTASLSAGDLSDLTAYLDSL